ncbi:MAG: hypothetical protein JKX73_04405 [Flavobacteriales bacterium]|nr:hypothetical protein [Flavobacteriales bacterium]
MIKLKFPPFILITALILTIGCTNEDEDEGNIDSFRTINIADSLGLDSGEATVFLLPAPLQVASSLRLQEVPYNSSLIGDIKENKGNAPEYMNALNLGRNTIDLGYAVVNGDLQLGISYSQNVKSLMNELGINSVVTANIIDRFEANSDNQDSLCQIILEAYGESHKYFQRNEREGMGLLILTGCFVEGLYLASSIENIGSNSQLQSLLGIHKEYLENILLLISFYNDNKEVSSLIAQLEGLEKEFESIELTINEDKGSARLNSAVSAEKLNAIRDKITVIRSAIRG